MFNTAHTTARLALAKTRPMTSLMDAEIIAVGEELVFYKSDWVPLYYDLNHKVRSDCGRINAFRARTLKGAFLWLVFTPEKARGYHADCSDPFEAIAMAERSWAGRRAVRANWEMVEQTARDLLAGRQQFDLRVEDLHACPLCTMGIEGFRRKIGLGRVTRIPGWLAALLMKVEPQVGFVIHAAKERQARQVDQGEQTLSNGLHPSFSA